MAGTAFYLPEFLHLHYRELSITRIAAKPSEPDRQNPSPLHEQDRQTEVNCLRLNGRRFSPGRFGRDRFVCGLRTAARLKNAGKGRLGNFAVEEGVPRHLFACSGERPGFSRGLPLFINQGAVKALLTALGKSPFYNLRGSKALNLTLHTTLIILAFLKKISV